MVKVIKRLFQSASKEGFQTPFQSMVRDQKNFLPMGTWPLSNKISIISSFNLKLKMVEKIIIRGNASYDWSLGGLFSKSLQDYFTLHQRKDFKTPSFNGSG